MAKIEKRWLISANDLRTGQGCYLRAPGTWVRDVAEATVVEERSDALTLLKLAETHHLTIVGPYLVELNLREGRQPEPVARRERIRLHGPTQSAPTARSAKEATDVPL